MAELKARYNNVVETTFHFQRRVKFLLAVMWVASSCANRVVSDF